MDFSTVAEAETASLKLRKPALQKDLQKQKIPDFHRGFLEAPPRFELGVRVLQTHIIAQINGYIIVYIAVLQLFSDTKAILFYIPLNSNSLPLILFNHSIKAVSVTNILLFILYDGNPDVLINRYVFVFPIFKTSANSLGVYTFISVLVFSDCTIITSLF